MNDDSDLRDVFARQRALDHEHAPSYQRVLQRAQADGQARSRGVPTWALGGFAAAMAVVVVTASASLWLKPARPSLVESLPVLLPPSRHDHSLFAELPMAPAALLPSDALLPVSLSLNVFQL